MTQLEAARQGIVTPEMTFVACREDLDAELVRSAVAGGRMLAHLAGRIPKKLYATASSPMEGRIASRK
jgi:thiamine biosynthesis protein ThiC